MAGRFLVLKKKREREREEGRKNEPGKGRGKAGQLSLIFTRQLTSMGPGRQKETREMGGGG